MKLIMLSKDHLQMAQEEALALAKPKKYERRDDMLILDDNSGVALHRRLGLSHAVYEHLFSASKDEFLQKVEEFAWSAVYRGSLCVRVHSRDFDERTIADTIYRAIGSPKVDLVQPKTLIEFFDRGDMFAALHISDVDKSYLNRKAHMRPSLHPTSLHPGLARACINLTGMQKGTILDPFCGSGGILIEAGLIGFDVIGIDNDPSQIQRAQKNLTHYLDSFRLEHADALRFDKRADAIVTDLPYGRGSKAKDLEELYRDFMEHARTLTDRMVIIVPDFLVPKTSGWKVQNRFRIYIHKSLTRIILQMKH